MMDRNSNEWWEWFASRPQEIQDAVRLKPPDRLYKINSGAIVYITAYTEDKAGQQRMAFGEVTVKVAITSEFNPGLIFEREVFGIPLNELVEVPFPTKEI